MKLKKNKTVRFPTSVFGVDHDPKMERIFVNCMDGVYVLTESTKETIRIGGHDSYGSSAALIPGSQQLITGGYDGSIKWFDATLKQKEVRSEKIHNFWSWDATVSSDGKWIASVSGQYLAGGYKYEPAPADEPTVKVIDAATGKVKHQFEHLPPVQCVAISSDSKWVAAGNLMGQVKVWSIQSGEKKAEFQSNDFTSWGIIKSHCYIGGLFSMAFSPDNQRLMITGMGPMRDPMAGNGKQRWQAFQWQDEKRVLASNDSQCGEGLMETLSIHPQTGHILIAGRLRGGEWNVGLFEPNRGDLIQSFKTSDRITDSKFSQDGKRLYLAATAGQPNPKKKEKSSFGKVYIYDVDPSKS